MSKKKFSLLIFSSLLSTHVLATNTNDQGSDLRSSKEFVATCPEQYLTYIDKSEGGPGAYCACPDKNINYIDKADGGPGFYCIE